VSGIARKTGSGECGSRAAERDDNWSPQRGGNVHRARIICQENAREFQDGHELAKSAITSAIEDAGVGSLDYFVAQIGIVWSADGNPDRIRELFADLASYGGESLGGPTLGGAVSGGWVESEPKRRGDGFKSFPFGSRLGREGRNGRFDLCRSDFQAGRERIGVCAERADKMEVIVNLV